MRGCSWRHSVSTRTRPTRCIREASSDVFFLFPSRRRHTRCLSDWSSDVCSSDLTDGANRAFVWITTMATIHTNARFAPSVIRGSESYLDRYGSKGRLKTLASAGRAATVVMDAIGRRGKVLRDVAGAARARRQLAAAMRAPAAERPFRAGLAERPLERADSRVLRVGGNVRVATLTVRSDLQHPSLLQYETTANAVRFSSLLPGCAFVRWMRRLGMAELGLDPLPQDGARLLHALARVLHGDGER